MADELPNKYQLASEALAIEAAQNSRKTGRKVPKGKPFEKGDARINRGGRPKKQWLTQVAEEMLEEKLSDPVQREIYKEALWSKMLSTKVVSAMMTERVWERTEGKLVTPVDVSGSLDIGGILEKWRNNE